MRTLIALLFFFLSGVAGLVYEVCWIRKASLIFGSTTFALSTVLAVFFAGLALGSWVFGKIAQRNRHPLRVYGLLELLLAATAALSLPFFGLVNGLYDQAFDSVSGNIVLLSLLRIGLVTLVLLPPTFFMGGTLPLFCRQFVVKHGSVAGRIGFLYGLNTLGAAVGCAATGFWLLPKIGVQASVLAAAACNLVIGVLILFLRVPAPECDEAPVEVDSGVDDRRRRVTIGTMFFSIGLIALGMEVLWSRFLALIVRNNVYTYTITLTVVLVGIVLGSLLAALVFDRRLPRALSFGALQVLTALSVMALMLMPVDFWRGMEGGLAAYCALMLIPAVLSGASFPLVNGMVIEDPRSSAATVGRMAAVNTVGGIVGSLLIGFVCLPLLGTMTSLRLLTGLGLVAGITAWLTLSSGRRLWPRLAIAGIAAALWISLPPLMQTRLPADFLASREMLIDFQEGQTSTLAVVRSKGNLTLEINRLWQGRDRKSHQIMAAHIPMIIHPAPRDILVIGAGTGQTPSRFLQYDVDRLHCVDIEPTIFSFITKHFDAPWLHDDRTRLITDDGRSWVAHTTDKYDLISIEVGQVFRPGVETFYTAEFYAEAAADLHPGGMVSQFVPLALCGLDEFRSIIATFLETFPNSSLWYNTSELLLIGTTGEDLFPDPDRLELLVNNALVNEDLRYSQWGGAEHHLNDPLNFLGAFLCGPNELATLAAGGQVYHDDRPVLAYAAGKVDMAQATEIPIAQLLRDNLCPASFLFPGPLRGYQAGVIGDMQQHNLRDIVAASHLRRVELLQERMGIGQAIVEIESALRWNADSTIGNRMMADALVLGGRDSESETYYLKALSLQADDGLAHRGYGMILLRQEKRYDALRHLNAALKLMPEDPATHNYIGVALASQGQIAEAIRHFETSLQLKPDYVDAQQNLERARTQTM